MKIQFAEISTNNFYTTTLNHFYQVTTLFDHHFVKIFHHNVKKERYFHSLEEANYSFVKNRFSVLKFIDENFLTSTGKYEFLVLYPERELLIHWEQETNIHVHHKNPNANILNSTVQFRAFDGLLSKPNSTSCLLDGELSDENWWYAIGTLHSYNGGIPGPVTNSEEIIVYQLSLWIRFDDFKQLQNFPNLIHNFFKTHQCRKSFSVFVFLHFSILS